ncbi:IS110 family transposase [Xenorhabdus nematophila]|uniref:IS110 family transposase n=3 Tax=Xenorhabdus nematophila TaxID=628 RepID=UPI0006936E85|nr:IS110 family transposase [Xenorhabdus nematophila]AYA41152.1 IS110 family transposase [Xenorhabdus nematophila]MBA0019897.1 IS110 family transposase [Xenorhabdus nematophila]MCB4426928.1 IS110 family transposase [Xenorhabdus nematophila]QNJ35554.1 IS110 family transposase [Xenorhabdus nematophila]
MMYYVGIDVSKNKLDICLLYDGVKGKRKTKSLLNNEHSACMLIEWLAKYIPALQQVNIVMEATGFYHERLAYSLHQAGGKIAIANPLRVRDFAKGILTKTDKMDAYILACYGALKQPDVWQPPPIEIRELKALLCRRDALLEDIQRERNRYEKSGSTHTPKRVIESLEAMMHHMKNELTELEALIAEHINQYPNLKKDFELLTSIKGVGTQMGLNMLIILRTNTFTSATQVAAYLGVIPIAKQSGTSVHGRVRLSKTGPAKIRAKLFMSALTAIRFNPHINDLYNRLVNKGKAKMLALGAAIAKSI